MLQATSDQITQGSTPWTVIAGIIGILGFILSFSTVICNLINNRINLVFRVRNYGIRQFNGFERLLVRFQIDNNSRLAVTVTDILLIVGDSQIPEDHNTLLVLPVTDNNLNCREVYTQHVPIFLSPLTSCAGYIAFPPPSDIQLNPDKPLTLRICTNRNTVVTKSFERNEAAAIRKTRLF